MTLVNATGRVTWNQARTRWYYKRMLGPEYLKLRFSHALEYLDTVPPASDDFDDEQDTYPELDTTKIGIIITERRPAI